MVPLALRVTSRMPFCLEIYPLTSRSKKFDFFSEALYYQRII